MENCSSAVTCVCFMFALSVSWDVDVQRFDLAPEQRQVAFAYVDIMK